MSGISSVIEELVIVLKKTLMPRISKAEWALMGLAMLLAVIGIFFLVLALDKYLEKTYAPDMAALVTAAFLLAAALLAILIRNLLHQKKEADARSAHKGNSQDNMNHIIQDVLHEMDDPVRENPKTAMILAALAGFFVANRAKL